MPQISFHTPLGPLTISEDNSALVALDWGWGRDQEETPLLLAARDQLQEYFDEERGCFDLPLAQHGSACARAVFDVVQAIPCGQTMTYAGVARLTSGTEASIGRVLATNRLPILVPSHRVLGRTGPGAFPEEAGGLAAKRFLLALEARWRRLG